MMKWLFLPSLAAFVQILLLPNLNAAEPGDELIASVGAAAAEGKYADGAGSETEISTLFGEATWGEIFKKLAGSNEITWTKSETNDAGFTGVQAGFIPQGAPPDIRVTMFLRSGEDGVRFDRMKFARGDESREKSGLDALRYLAEGLRGEKPSRTSAISLLNKNHARQLILGCLIYGSENDNKFPPNVDTLLAAKVIEEKLQWRHPETDKLMDFLYYGAGKISGKIPNDAVIFAAPLSIEGKRTVAQADGAVIDLPEAEFQKAIGK